MEFKHPKAKSLLYGFLILGLSVSPFILLFPVYKINIFFGLSGKWALIFPYAASSISFNTLLLTAYLKQLPTEIDEAAVIDGCNILAADGESYFANGKAGYCNNCHFLTCYTYGMNIRMHL